MYVPILLLVNIICFFFFVGSFDILPQSNECETYTTSDSSFSCDCAYPGLTYGYPCESIHFILYYLLLIFSKAITIVFFLVMTSIHACAKFFKTALCNVSVSKVMNT